MIQVYRCGLFYRTERLCHGVKVEYRSGLDWRLNEAQISSHVAGYVWWILAAETKLSFQRQTLFPLCCKCFSHEIEVEVQIMISLI